MRTMMTMAAGCLLAGLLVGCGQSEAERQAEEARKSAEAAAKQVEAATDAAAKQIEAATKEMTAQMQGAAAEMSKSANQMADAAKKEGAQAAATVMQASADAAVAAATATQSAAVAMSSAATTAAVKTALLTTAGLDASGINVDTSPDGKIVILKGTVKTAGEKNVAEKTAHSAVPTADGEERTRGEVGPAVRPDLCPSLGVGRRG